MKHITIQIEMPIHVGIIDRDELIQIPGMVTPAHGSIFDAYRTRVVGDCTLGRYGDERVNIGVRIPSGELRDWASPIADGILIFTYVTDETDKPEFLTFKLAS